MPAQKRAQEAPENDPSQSDQDNNLNEHPEDGEAEDSDRSLSSSIGEKDEFVVVKLSEIRKEVQCPICLGIIRKTRTVMECLHRFCRECIDKSMRLGNNECPACRTHCPSRRSLRDDPNYDALIAALYPDIDKYENEELAFQEEEKARNKQIQASIAQTFRRQSESLGRKRATSLRRFQGNNYRNFHSRGRRNFRNANELPESDDNEDTNGNNGGRDSSSGEEHMEPKPKRPRRRGPARLAQPSSPAANACMNGDENDADGNSEMSGPALALVSGSERLAWGKGGIRSHARHGGMSGSNSKNARNSRFSKLADYLQNSEDNDEELEIQLMLVSLDEQKIPALQRSYLCCRPTLCVRHLHKYIALQTALSVDEIEIYLVKELHAELSFSTSGKILVSDGREIEESKDKLQLLKEQETLAELKAHSIYHGYLLLAYQKKL